MKAKHAMYVPISNCCGLLAPLLSRCATKCSRNVWNYQWLAKPLDAWECINAYLNTGTSAYKHTWRTLWVRASDRLSAVRFAVLCPLMKNLLRATAPVDPYSRKSCVWASSPGVGSKACDMRRARPIIHVLRCRQAKLPVKSEA